MALKTSERLVALEKRIHKVEGFLDGRFDALCDAAQNALAHILELEDAWQRGAIESRDGLNGVRSNTNVEVRVAIEKALNDLTNPSKDKS